MKESIFVTQPALPPMKEFVSYLERIWDSKILTNGGPLHNELEAELASYLDAPFVSLFCNATQALIVAFQALGIGEGEVITSPYSFIATSHSICLNGLKPVFVDVEDEFFNLDPSKIEAAVTEKTKAIMPVHVYGNPAQVEKIDKIAKKYNLKVIYDAAHAFGVRYKEQSLVAYGDLSVLSFHATKVYSTIEGGAIIAKSQEMKDRIDKLKNFGIKNENEVEMVGTNAKLNEFQAAYGLLDLKYVDEHVRKRKEVTESYHKKLNSVEGLTFLPEPQNCTLSYSYLPVIIDEKKFGISRDVLYEKLKEKQVFCRKYFYPLITNTIAYRKMNIEQTQKFPVAEKITQQVMCLPLYVDLTEEEIRGVCQAIVECKK